MNRDDTIVRAAIHPGIGIARVGNSPDAYFIGPELPYPVAAPDGGYKDGPGALKRQAARFRIYGYNQAGEVVGELTADDAEIVWTVYVANKKAAWYNFEFALDIPEAIPCARRNAAFVGEARRQLVIDPGARSIAGRGQGGDGHRFDTGQFCGQPIYLGELRTDEQGRLIFLGGRGHSGTVYPHNTPADFANNNGWYDDISDGPVGAEVTLGGRRIPVDPAWVVVAPPNFAPDMIGIPSMYDLLYDVYQGDWLDHPDTPSFTRQIYPILRRFYDLQWVNNGFYVQFGWGGPYDFLRESYFARLADPGEEYQEARRQIFHMFRNPAASMADADAWPPVYGDDMTAPSESPRRFLSLTQTQYNDLQRWAENQFVADWDQRPRHLPQRIEDVPLAQQPATLDRAALTFCLGGPFYPGCEMTWPMRHETMYCAPFRIRPRAPGQPEPDYGDQLTPAVANELNENGPLYANGPGDITRWLPLPWQTDSASCRAGFDPDYDPYLPTFWPARVPNDVLRESDYRRVIDTSLPIAERVRAFNTRAHWQRGLSSRYLDRINDMVTRFGELGVVERRDWSPQGDEFPAVMYVETQADIDDSISPARNRIVDPASHIARHHLSGASGTRRPRK